MFEKFKEREPLDTVNVIKALFNRLSPDFEIKVEGEMGEDIKVFSCAVRLYYKDKLILRANGKGMKREFALASGYAELFERFSNELNVDGFFYPYLDSTYGEDVKVFEELKYFPQCAQNAGMIRNFLLEEGPEIRAVKYKKLTEGEDALIDPRHMLIINGTNGMAAGNTLNEALNQGISELCERFVITRAYNGDMYFDEIPLTLVKEIAPESYSKCQKIISRGFDIRFFDASGYTGLPVVMSLWVDKARGIHAVRMGSFPAISIAIERCITENLQGRSLNDTWDYLKNVPFSGATRDGLHKLLTIFKEDFPEKIYKPEKVLNDINENVYFKGCPSNDEMLERYISIFNRLGIEIYYRDCSLSDDFASVQVHSPILNMDLTPEYIIHSDDGIEDLDEFMVRLKNADFSFSDCLKIAQARSKYANREFRQFLSYRFKNTCIKNCPYEYIRAIACYYTDDEALAYELLTINEALDIKSEAINKLRSYLSYKLSYPELGQKELLDMLSTWGYTKDDFNLILAKDDKFLKEYLWNVIFNDEWENEMAMLYEIRGIIDKARKNFREKE